MKFTIVTPAFNSERFIRQTIESIIQQSGDFSIEYIVLDNLSTDATPDIVRKYQALLASGALRPACREVKLDFYSERDSGMYDAINRGFSRATGDVFAWLNSDDMYLPGALDVVSRTLKKYPRIEWLKGICCYINANSTMFGAGECHLYRQDFLKAGLYGPVLTFVQQESVFWRADLWARSGGVDATLKVASDYFLWKSFAKYAPLYSLNAYVSCFRKTPTQKSADIQAYFAEIDRVEPPDAKLSARTWRYLRRFERLPMPWRALAHRMLFGRQPYHLVVLDQGIEPRLVDETDYFALERRVVRLTPPAIV